MDESKNVRVYTEEIMQEIKQDIKNKGYCEKILNFREVDLHTDISEQECYAQDTFEEHVSNMNHIYAVKVEHKQNVNIAKRIMQKIVAKFIRFYIEPIVEEQVQYNMEVVNAMNQIRLYHIQSQQDIEELNSTERESVYDITQKIQMLEKEIDEIRRNHK